MKHLIWTLAVTASLAAPLPAAGQHAVPRGGGGSDSGSSSSGGGSTGGSSSSGGGGGSSWGSGSDSGSSGRTSAPPRHPGGSSSGRSRGGDSGSTASGRRSPGTGSSSGSGSGSGSGYGSDRVVGGTGRTRDGRPITGYAVPRGTVVPSGRPGGDYNLYPRGTDWYFSPFYYSRYSPYYYSGFGASLWGLGYIWDPFWFGPGYGYGDSFGYGGGGYGYGGGYGGGGYANDEQDDVEAEAEGGLRIKVKPREARVLVDGTFAGVVDDFDGNFQRLRLDAGAHKIELQADGFEPLRFDVLIVEGQTVTYKGSLREH